MTDAGPADRGPLVQLGALRPRSLRGAGDPTPPGTEVRRDGVVLFADVSGFTPLTERLALSGREGAERLSRFVDDRFGELIDIVEAAGGDVWSLAGDGLLAWWAAGDEPREAVAAAAVGAAQRGLAAIHGGAGPDGRTIRMRASLASGEIRISVLGPAAATRAFLSGEAIAEAARVDADALPGQVTVSAPLVALLPEWSVVTRGSVGVVQLPVRGASVPGPGELAVVTAAAAPAPVAATLVASGRRWTAEFRPGSAVFVQLPGFAELPLASRTAAVVDLVAAVDAHGAHLDRVAHEDKGELAVALLGVPGHQHEDDAARAVRTAQALVAAGRSHGIEARAGVATGTVFCVVLGADDRHEYAAMGDVMNRASRLMQLADAAAPVVVDDRTRLEAPSLGFRSTGRVRLKGLDSPVEVHAPAPATDPPRPASQAVVGRAPEIARIVESIRRQDADGPVTTVVVEGEAGIGKSALVAAAVAEATRQGVDADVVVGAASQSERATPFRIWRGVLAGALDLDEAAPPSEVAIERALGAALPAGPAPLDRQVAALVLGVPVRGAPIAPDAVVLALVDLLQRLRQARGRPVVVVLEDAYWGDSASLSLLRVLAAEGRGAVLIMTVRPTGADEVGAALGSAPAGTGTRIGLGALDRSGVEALIAHTVGAARCSSRLADAIGGRTAGHPLFTQQLVLALRDRGMLDASDGVARLTESALALDAGELPSSVTRLLGERIDGLPAEPQRLLKSASVVGRTFSVPALRVLAPDVADPECHLRRLVDAELVQPVDGTAGRYEFQHALVRDTAYDLLAYSLRREQNRLLASWYEAGAEAASPARLAHHLLEADDVGRAVPHVVAAAEISIGAAAHAEGAALYRRAVEAVQAGQAPSPGDAVLAAWYERLGFAEQSCGALDEARAALEHALELLGRPMPSDRRLPVEVLGLAARQAARRIRWRGPRRGARPDPTVPLLTRCYEGIVQVAYMSEHPSRSIYGILAGVLAGEEGQATPELPRHLVSMATVCTFAQLGRWSEHYVELGLDAAGQLEDPVDLGITQLYLGIHAMTVGDWDRSRRATAAALDALAAGTEPRRELEARSIAGIGAFHAGDVADALDAFRHLHAGARRIDHRWMEGVALIEQAMVHVRHERWHEAERLLSAADALGDVIGSASVAWGGGLRSVALLELGDRSGAARCLEDTIRRTAGVRPSTSFALEGYAGLGEAAHRLRGAVPARVRRAAGRQLGQLAAVAPMARPRALLVRARRAVEAGRVDRAVALHERAASAAAALGVPYEEGMARLHLAQLADSAARRTDQAERARSLLARAQAPTPTARAAALIG